MNIISKNINYLMLGAFIVLGTACSSGGGGGDKDAEISEENKVALATAGTEGVKQAVDSTNSPIPFAKTDNNTPIQQVTLSLAQTVAQDPKQATSEFFSCDSGTAILDIDDSTGNGSFDFNACRINFSGSSYIEYNGGASFDSDQRYSRN